MFADCLGELLGGVPRSSGYKTIARGSILLIRMSTPRGTTKRLL